MEGDRQEPTWDFGHRRTRALDVTVPYDQPSTPTGRVVVYSESPEEGSPINVIHVPVTFTDW